MNALLNYPGAKWGMAKQICSLMPAHRSYLEPFFGSGAVLFNKPPPPLRLQMISMVTSPIFSRCCVSSRTDWPRLLA